MTQRVSLWMEIIVRSVIDAILNESTVAVVNRFPMPVWMQKQRVVPAASHAVNFDLVGLPKNRRDCANLAVVNLAVDHALNRVRQTQRVMKVVDEFRLRGFRQLRLNRTSR